MTKKCPSCKRQLIIPNGPKKSEYLFVGDSPGKEELWELAPFVGPAGRVLNEELQRLGRARGEFRVTNLWLHSKPNKSDDKHDACLEFCLTKLLEEELPGKKYIFLMGSDTVSTLCEDKKVSEWEGLQVISPYFIDRLTFASLNPAIALRGPKVIGDFRLALEKFFKAVHENGSQ